jgi:hypothetical protein
MNENNDFRDRLVSAQQFTPAYRENYRKGLESMLTRRLTPTRRIVCAALAVSGLCAAVSFGVQAVAQRSNGEYAAWGRAAFGVMALWGLAWAALLGAMAIRGTVNLRKDRQAIAGLRWFFFVFVGILLMLVGGLQLKYEPGSSSPVFAAVIGLGFLVYGALVVIHNLVQQSELNVREKLLEIELKLAEMSEMLAGKQG